MEDVREDSDTGAMNGDSISGDFENPLKPDPDGTSAEGSDFGDAFDVGF
jgi:hypothetical protein